jgi:DNA-binding NtrC family response regulator
VDGFTAQMVKDYQPSQYGSSIVGKRGTIRLAVEETSVFNYEGLLRTLLGFLQQIQARRRIEAEETKLENELVVASPLMREAWDRVRRASQCDEVVLLLGESGTGKTFIAQKIHALSPRRQGPFIQVGLTSDLGSDNIVLSNLFGHERGAFTGATEQKQGLFSLANGGTILLDEIGDASPELQAKLLRVIDTSTFKRLGGVQDIKVDVRVIAATHQPVEAMVHQGKFRQDLYYRLNVIPIRVPPLREQPDSIPALANFLLARITRTCGNLPRTFSPELLSLLQHYPWPGNIRELEHALRHAVAMSDAETLKPADLPSAIRTHFQTQPEGRPAQTDTSRAAAAARIVDREALRLAIRASDPRMVAETIKKYELSCHIDFIRKTYLATLIEECKGDLSLIRHYWDHGSEKTLRNLIRAYDLADLLHAVRSRAKDAG